MRFSSSNVSRPATMSYPKTAERIIVAVGAVIWNARGEILLVRRQHPPKQDEWSLPGGRVEFGETLRDALAREIREETGLEIDIVGLVDVVELVDHAGSDGAHYVLVDFCARAHPGEAVAASDAAEARWFSLAATEALPLWRETRRVIGESAKLRTEVRDQA